MAQQFFTDEDVLSFKKNGFKFTPELMEKVNQEVASAGEDTDKRIETFGNLTKELQDRAQAKLTEGL